MRALRKAGKRKRDVKDVAGSDSSIVPQRTIGWDEQSNAYIIRDKQSTVRGVLHTQKPVVIDASEALDAAESYLRTHSEAWGLQSSELENLRLRPQADPIETGVEYRFISEKRQFDLSTVTFQQTCLGLPVWQAAVSVHLKRQPKSYQVISAQTLRQEELTRDGLMPTPERIARLKSIDPPTLARQLGIADKVSRFDVGSMAIRHQNLMIYRYDAVKRDQTAVLPNAKGRTNPDAMPLPPVPPDIADGSYNVVAAVYFDLKRKDRPSTHWVALIEAKTLSVLFLEEFSAGVNGKVFLADPITTNGGPQRSATNAKLNPRRVLKALPNLGLGNPQKLVGANVRIRDFEDPENDVPSKAQNADFVYNARTNEFAAVNAYFNCDRFFGYVEDLGFRREDYFPGQTFPIEVDPRGTPTVGSGDPDSVTAQCRGTTRPGPNGSVIGSIDNVIFCLADPVDTTSPLGLACDWRIVLHELGGHGTLQNHVNSSSFMFCHSAGDSLAAILNDPESKAPRKGRTFPWVFGDIDRQHDRKVKSGWAWDGPKDLHDDFFQLQREQILSTTHFRLYQAIGGGNQTKVDDRQLAAEFASYLIFRAIQMLTPATNPQHASDWMLNLIAADSEDWTSKGRSGGAYEKIIRWAFEKQGLFGGHPPDVDVYIDDGRKGEYKYKSDYASCAAIWNRKKNDGLGGHQAPVPNVPNFAYVKIKNRGGKSAKSVVVNALQNKPQSQLVYPDDWRPMTTAQLPAADLPPHSSAVKVGPFEWVPNAAGDNVILMAVSASGDASNLGKFAGGKSIPASRLVPNDNNLGMRKV